MVSGKDIRSASLVGLGMVLLLGIGCTRISGSGRIVTKPVHLSLFSRIQVSNVFDVNISFGDQQKVTLRVDDNLVDHIDVGVSNGMLHLGLKSRTSINGATLHADVITRSLSRVQASGASKIHFAGVCIGDRLEVMLSGASHLDGPVNVGEGRAELSGASNATLSGTAGRLEIQASGARRSTPRISKPMT